MKICMILPDHYYPPDIRVENEAKSLLEAGHEVHLVCPNRVGGLNDEIVEGVQVHRLPQVPEKYRNHEFLWNVPFPFNPIWIKKIKEIVRKHKIEIFHVHDLPLVTLCIVLGKMFKIPVIFDMHENWPVAMKFWGYGKFYLPAKILERFSIRYADHVIVVVDEQKERLMKLGVPYERISVIMNTVNLEMFNEERVIPELVSELKSKYADDFIVSYIGGFGEHRGIETLIEAMPDVVRQVPNVRLLLVGDGKIREKLENLSKKLNVQNHVIYTGWVDVEKVPTYISESDVCVIPHLVNEHIETTIPHKLFQYMAMEKPIISTDARPLKRIIESEKCGLVIPSGDVAAMAEAIIKLSNKELADLYSKNGKNAALEIYNWDITTRKLYKIYNNIIC
ncbi:MAG: glycosyltransferase family 4 protein [Methanosarcinaceae archaeon]|nr:glycosyltransferase family 4 protein [Methanosarcinaceae archaeon]